MKDLKKKINDLVPNNFKIFWGDTWELVMIDTCNLVVDLQAMGMTEDEAIGKALKEMGVTINKINKES